MANTAQIKLDLPITFDVDLMSESTQLPTRKQKTNFDFKSLLEIFVNLGRKYVIFFERNSIL